MKVLLSTCAIAATLFATAATQPSKPVAFKLGTFAQGQRTFLGLVLNDATVIDLSKADSSLPSEMKVLLERYDSLGPKLQQIAAKAANGVDVKTLKTLPPVMPQNILNAAVNYTEHAQEMAGVPTSTTKPAPPPADGITGIWTRKPGDTRHNPYVFPKMVGAVIGNGDTIRLPTGRTQVDWECELAVVIGRTASRVSADAARNYIAGFTLENDVSDRAGRGDARHGSDWFIGKSHDTFAPLGPYIVPKEFVSDPQKLPIKFTLSGNVMQDSSTERMTHTVYEMVSYVSHILTLKPGDIIATGSPAGVGAARNVFMKSGDTSVCTIGEIGTLTNPVR